MRRRISILYEISDLYTANFYAESMTFYYSDLVLKHKNPCYFNVVFVLEDPMARSLQLLLD